MNTWSIALQNLNTRTEPPKPDVPSTKQCSGTKGCGKVLPISEFSVAKYRLNGKPAYQYICRKCATVKREAEEMPVIETSEWTAGFGVCRQRSAVAPAPTFRKEERCLDG